MIIFCSFCFGSMNDRQAEASSRPHAPPPSSVLAACEISGNYLILRDPKES
jgi:hypothetical protein